MPGIAWVGGPTWVDRWSLVAVCWDAALGYGSCTGVVTYQGVAGDCETLYFDFSFSRGTATSHFHIPIN